MLQDNDNTISVGIIADPSNYAAEQFFEKQLSLTISRDSDLNPYRVTSDALTQSISSRLLTDEISGKLNKGYQVVVAILGVPDASGYKTDIHGLLNAWERSAQKPALLLVSNRPELTREMVESWAGWKQLPQELKSAIKVNDEYLVINANKSLEAIQERAACACNLKRQLCESLNAVVQPIIMRPVFTQSSQISMPYVVKG
jgi:hypothetical protein